MKKENVCGVGGGGYCDVDPIKSLQNVCVCVCLCVRKRERERALHDSLGGQSTRCLWLLFLLRPSWVRVAQQNTEP